MFEKKDYIVKLISKYFRNELTPEDSAALNEWLSENEEHRNLLTQLSDDNIMEAKMRLLVQAEIPDVFEKVKHRMNAEIPIPEKGSRSLSQKSWVIAACLLALTGLCAWYFTSIIREKVIKVTGTTLPVLSFPAKKAALQTANNTIIALNNLKDGPVKTEGAFKVIKNKGYLSYIPDLAISTDKALYNTITTPRGGHYRIVLPDSSIISMNVASSVTFKVSSAGSIREVTMTGEAAFDITTNPDQPFMVTILPQNNRGKAARVKVTGTRFNINAYNDKKITLLEGSLNVMALAESNSKSKIMSRPGEQVLINDNGSINIIEGVDTAGVVAWKNGYVHFTGRPQEILNIIEKWYDVEVIYQTNSLPQKAISGTITPGMNINTVIDIMHHQYNGLHLKYDSIHNKIVVLP